eukprot:TRINITY_DN132_c2_g3_i1.p1 TRINITY_DN132_c2_g3~~TRINITY_DN132_c2_g3_i1.p1  ORF type:complete len:237 (-),score=90.22 TRINITY_DN132_c2_g3_i1:83-730(-)
MEIKKSNSLLIILSIINFWFVLTINCDKVAPAWPDSFSAPFLLTVYGFRIIGGPSMIYFDWTQKAQRLDFNQGCPVTGDPLQPCSVLFTSTQAFLITNNGSSCCCTAHVGTLPPTWTQVMSYNGSGPAYGKYVDWWRWDDDPSLIHNYLTIPPLNTALYLLVQDIYEEWVFTEPFNVGPQSKDLFVVPSNCKPSCSFKTYESTFHKIYNRLNIKY